MKCPYCDAEMEKGFIEGGSSEMTWKKEKTGIFGSVNEKEEDVVLAPFSFHSFVGKNRLEAYICKCCKKVIVDYSREGE